MEFHEDYINNKIYWLKFNKTTTRTKAAQDYAHSDISGPTTVDSQMVATISLIDDCSRKIWVYLLKVKAKPLKGSRSVRPWLKNKLERSLRG